MYLPGRSIPRLVHKMNGSTFRRRCDHRTSVALTACVLEIALVHMREHHGNDYIQEIAISMCVVPRCRVFCIALLLFGNRLFVVFICFFFFFWVCTLYFSSNKNRHKNVSIKNGNRVLRFFTLFVVFIGLEKNEERRKKKYKQILIHRFEWSKNQHIIQSRERTIFDNWKYIAPILPFGASFSAIVGFFLLFFFLNWNGKRQI